MWSRLPGYLMDGFCESDVRPMARPPRPEMPAQWAGNERQIAEEVNDLVPGDLVGEVQGRVCIAVFVEHKCIVQRPPPGQSCGPQPLDISFEGKGPRRRGPALKGVCRHL